MEYKDFNEYMEFYKTQSLSEKRDIILEQLKMLASLSNDMCKELNVENELILNKELIDINKENYSEDDFLEATITLVNSIQNSICDFDLKLTDIMNKQKIDLD